MAPRDPGALPPARPARPGRPEARGAASRARGGLVARLFGDVGPGEGLAVALLACNAFLMLTAYYVLKTVREPLVLLGGTHGLSGPEVKTYATAGQAIVLAGLVPLYGRLASRVNRASLITRTVGILVGCLVAFNVLGHLDVPIGLPFYFWLGLTSLVGVAQFWSFANDYYTRSEGERLFPLVAAGGSVGAIVGARAARFLLEVVGLLDLMLVAAALLVLYGVIHDVIERLPHPRPAAAIEAQAPVGRAGGFSLVRRTPYLLLIGVMVLLANLVNTQGEYILARAVNAHAEEVVPDPVGAADAAAAAAAQKEVREARRKVVGQFYGDFFSTVNLLAFLLQIVVVSRLFKRLGVHRALFVFPLVALGAYGLIAALPVYLLVGAAKVAENGVDYSVHNTVRQALFLPTSREAKYKAKAAIDTFFFRAGDLAAAGAVFVGVHLLGLSLRGFALANAGIIGGWLLVVAAVAHRYDRVAEGRGDRARLGAGGPTPLEPPSPVRRRLAGGALAPTPQVAKPLD